MVTATTATIQSVQNALEVLDCLVFDPKDAGGMSLSQLAARVDLPANSVHRVLQTLIACGYARQVARGRYAAGPKIDSVARRNRVLYGEGLARIERVVEAAGGELREMITFVTLVDGNWRPVTYKTADQDVVVRPVAQHPDSIYTLSTGRVLTAFASAEECERILAVHGLPGERWDGIADRDGFDAACARLREDGVCVIEQAMREVVMFAVPVTSSRQSVSTRMTPDDKLFGALGCSLPLYRAEGEKLGRMIAVLQQYAARLGEEMNA